MVDDYDECIFDDPEVYGCIYSENKAQSGHVKECFASFTETDLLDLLNALFPGTSIYVHAAEGNNTSDTWECHDRIYHVEHMTLECMDSYTDYGGGGPNGYKSWKERFALSVPKMEYVQALIDISTADGNSALTSLLIALSQKINNNLIVFDDKPDNRVIGEKYDEEGNIDNEDYIDEE